jgi:lipopolysaccharide biosynthesis regulator YciM
VLHDDPSCERALLYRGKLNKRANKVRDALRDFDALLKQNPGLAVKLLGALSLRLRVAERLPEVA